jgi:hypothetical protein
MVIGLSSLPFGYSLSDCSSIEAVSECCRHAALYGTVAMRLVFVVVAARRKMFVLFLRRFETAAIPGVRCIADMVSLVLHNFSFRFHVCHHCEAFWTNGVDGPIAISSVREKRGGKFHGRTSFLDSLKRSSRVDGQDPANLLVKSLHVC